MATIPRPREGADKDIMPRSVRLGDRLYRLLPRYWVVEPSKGRSAERGLKYLARYVERVTRHDARMVEVSDTEVVLRGRRRLVRVDRVQLVRRSGVSDGPAFSFDSVGLVALSAWGQPRRGVT